MWDETLADSSLLNKAPSKGGGGGGEQRERTQVQARSTKVKVGHHRAKEQINVGFVLGKTCEMDCLSSFENAIQDSDPPTIHLHALCTFGILPSGRCIQIKLYTFWNQHSTCYLTTYVGG
jgi:hypothetical protein